MIISVHIADLDLRTAVRSFRDPTKAGTGYLETAFCAPLGGGIPKLPSARRLAAISSWESEAALDDFLEADSLGRELDRGWHAAFKPLRVFGAWPSMSGLPDTPLPDLPEEPIAALTLGRPRPHRLAAFIRTSKQAERQSLMAPGLIRATGLAHPPRLVSTFSIWSSIDQMRNYAHGSGGAHQNALDRDRANPFHAESAFIRLRPIRSAGLWDGSDPLAGFCD